MAHGDDDEVLAGHLAGGMSCAAAARKIGCHERTVRRRLEDPDFKRLLDSMKTAIVSSAVAILGKGMTEAARTLRTLLKSNNEGIKLGAARSIIELHLKAHSTLSLDQRIDELLTRLDGAEKAK